MLVGIGFFVGTPAVIDGSRFIGKELHEMNPLDAPSLTVALRILAAAAFLATLIPALRASLAEPTAALRQN